MSQRSLADFLDELGHAGELIRVEAAVDPLLEVAAVTDRVAKSQGSALLFGAVRGHDVPLVTNLLGSEARICMALHVPALCEVASRIAALACPQEPEGWFERLKASPHEAWLRKLMPRSVNSGICQQVIRLGGDVDLGELPLLHCWPGEAGRMITAGQLFTTDAGSGGRVAGRYDLEMLDRNRLAVFLSPHDEPARLLCAAASAGQRLPLAIVFGGDPRTLLSLSAPLPPGSDPAGLAGVLREKPLEMVKCRSIELEVPADAEIVLEGYIDPREAPVKAGPRCTPLGQLAPARLEPVLHVTTITHRANPVFSAMVYGRPPHEEALIHRAMWRVLLPLLKSSIPELADLDLPMFGAARHWAIAAIHKTYAGQARKVAHALWGLRPPLFAKITVLVDAGVDVHDVSGVLEAIATHVDPGRDVMMVQGPPDPLDVATLPERLAQPMAVDATAKLPDEQGGYWPAAARTTDEIERLLSERWTEYQLGPEPKADDRR
jgi:4-hydroxy-3-polyprenylbenzoate decarboxylase